jgi:hypothetical protein
MLRCFVYDLMLIYFWCRSCSDIIKYNLLLLKVIILKLMKSIPLKMSFTTFFFFGATAPIWALAYLHETLRFISVF